MSSRQTTTIAVLVTMRLPVGAHAADGIEFVKDAISSKCELSRSLAPALPISALDENNVTFKLVKKETHYL